MHSNGIGVVGREGGLKGTQMTAYVLKVQRNSALVKTCRHIISDNVRVVVGYL